MSAGLAPPTKLVRALCVLIGIMIFAPQGYRAMKWPGLAVGVLLGAPIGWALGGWVKRTFLEL